MSSAILSARRALFDLLTNDSVLAGSQVIYGPPTADEDFEVVALGGVEDPREEEAELGAGHKWEKFVLVVYVKVHNPAADDAQEVEDRLYEMSDAVRDVVHFKDGSPNRTLGGAVFEASVISVTTEHQWGTVPLEHGWGCILIIRILCKARVT